MTSLAIDNGVRLRLSTLKGPLSGRTPFVYDDPPTTGARRCLVNCEEACRFLRTDPPATPPPCIPRPPDPKLPRVSPSLPRVPPRPPCTGELGVDNRSAVSSAIESHCATMDHTILAAMRLWTLWRR